MALSTEAASNSVSTPGGLHSSLSDVAACCVHILGAAQVVAKIVEAKLSRSEQPLLFLRMHIAQYKLVQGDMPGTKALIEAGKESLEQLPDVRSSSRPRCPLRDAPPSLSTSRAHSSTA